MAVAKSPNTLPPPGFEKPVKLLVVTAPYHQDITDELLAGAKAALSDAGVGFDTVEVSGVLEIPTAIAIAERRSNFDGYVALGCILRGQTRNHKAVRNTCYQAISQMGLNGVCIGNGILTVRKLKQAKARASATDRNYGGNAAIAALHLVALSRKWGRETKGIGFKPASSEFLMADSSENGPNTA